MGGILFPLFLISCTSIESLDVLKQPIYNYEADLKMTVDGETHSGFGATFIDKLKVIKIDAPVKLDYLFVHTCGRFKRYPDWDQAKLGSKSVTFSYRPVGAELSGCPIFFEVYNLNGITAWGMMAFRLGNEMPAKTFCNGIESNFLGHSVCQSKPGIEHVINFSNPKSVRFLSRSACLVKEVSKNSFRFRAVMDWCSVAFTDGEKYHFLTIKGFERPLIRE